MMTPVCRTNDQWPAKFRLASDPTQYASQPYVIFVLRVEVWAERLHFRRGSGCIEAVGADEASNGEAVLFIHGGGEGAYAEDSRLNDLALCLHA
jgi:hypothetical protein